MGYFCIIPHNLTALHVPPLHYATFNLTIKPAMPWNKTPLFTKELHCIFITLYKHVSMQVSTLSSINLSYPKIAAKINALLLARVNYMAFNLNISSSIQTHLCHFHHKKSAWVSELIVVINCSNNRTCTTLIIEHTLL